MQKNQKNCYRLLGIMITLATPVVGVLSCSNSSNQIIIKSSKKKSKEEEPQNNKTLLTQAVHSLKWTALDRVANMIKLPSEITKANVLNELKQNDPLHFIAYTKKVMLQERDITLSPNDEKGTLQVTIKNHGKDKKITIISGFSTSEMRLNDLKSLEVYVQNINEYYFLAMTRTKLPSEIRRMHVLSHILRKMDDYGASEAEKNLLQESDITLSPNDEKATLQITIKNHGVDKDILIENFITSFRRQNDSDYIGYSVRKLSSKDFNRFIFKNSNYLASTIKRPYIFLAIAEIFYARNADSWKYLLKENDITLEHDDSAGTLALTIKNHGSDKVLILSGFKTRSNP